MHTRSDPAQTRYRKLYRLGYWCCPGAYFKIPGGQIMEIGVEFEIRAQARTDGWIRE